MKLEDKKRIRLVTLKKDVSMKFEDRLAYSFLLATVKGMTQTRLAKMSGLDRTSTLPKVLSRLLSKGLIIKRGNRYFGLPNNVVVIDNNRQNVDNWYHKICYLKYYIPTDLCPLTKKQLAVYYLLHKSSCKAWLAKVLNISRPAVNNAIKLLKQHGLVDRFDDVIPIPEDKLNWWQDKDKRINTESNFQNYAAEFNELIKLFNKDRNEAISLHPWVQTFNNFGRLCGEAGYSFEKVNDLLEEIGERLGGKVTRIGRVFLHLEKTVIEAEKITKQNRKYNCSFGLFRLKLIDLVKKEKLR